MAIRTIAELKSYFQGAWPGPDRPTAQQFTDLLDSLQWFDDMASAGLAAASPVIVVVNQAAMLSDGPVYKVGQRIKTTEDGLTWVKQNQPGTAIENYAAIGDTGIVIDDVIGLQTALNNRLVRDQVADEICAGRLGVLNLATPQVGEWPVTGAAPSHVEVEPMGPGLNYASVPLTGDSVLTVEQVLPGDPVGRSVTGFLLNGSGAALDLSLGSGMLGTNGSWPVNLGAGKWLSTTLTWIEHPVNGPLILVAFNNEI